MKQKQIFRTARALAVFTIIFTLLPLSSCGLTPAAREKERFSAFTLSCFKEFASENSLILHSLLADPSAYGLSSPEKLVSGLSAKEAQKRTEGCRKMRRDLHAFSRDRLSRDQQLTYDLLEYKLECSIEAADYRLYESLLGTTGLPSQLPASLSEYSFRNAGDVDEYLALLRQVPDVLTDLVAFEEERAAAGYGIPDPLLDQTLNEIDRFLDKTGNDQLLISSFKDRLDALEAAKPSDPKAEKGAKQREKYIEENESIVKDRIFPAYRTLKQSLAQMRSKAPAKEGLCQFERGDRYYRLLLKSQVGTDKSPKDCIRLLEGELAKTLEEVRQLKEADPQLYTDYLAAEPALSDPRQILVDLEKKAKKDFPDAGPVSYTILDLPDSLAASSSSAYFLLPPLDAKEENLIYLNKIRLSDRDLFPTLAHEGWPGHMYQVNYSRARQTDPLRCLLTTDGWNEGWASYAQLYSFQYLDFKEPSQEKKTKLRQLYRAQTWISMLLASLSDLYVHTENYDKQKLRKYLSPYGIGEEASDGVYDYIIGKPAAHLCYSMGYLEIQSLLEQSRQEEGASFELKAFHEKILSCGSCPFGLLARNLTE